MTNLDCRLVLILLDLPEKIWKEAVAVIGGIQVIYNVARFGNPLDFGIRYSLTINDFTRAQYHTDFVMIGHREGKTPRNVKIVSEFPDFH